MKIKHVWTKFWLLTIATIAVSLAGTSAVFADGGAADGWNSGGDKTDSGWCNKDWDWDSCGAGFVRMNVDNPVALINSGNHSGYPSVRSYIQNTVVPACKKADATEFYLLALHVMSGGSPTGTFGNTRYVYQLKSVNDGGSGHIPYRAGSGAVQFSEANRNFFTAQGYAKGRIAKYPAEKSKYESLLNTTWPNVTWFCWNPGWETQEAETSFGAFSIVVSDKINNGSRNSTYPNVDSKKTWEITSNEDKVRVTFAHKFFYYNGNKLSNNTTERASTDWNLTITRDGKGYYETDHVGTIYDNQFHDTFSLTGYQKVTPFTGSNGSNCPGNICAEDVGVNTYDIDISNLGLGESTVVCSEISYDPKAFLWRSENGSPFTIVKRTNGNKSSTGCVKITRGAGENLEFWSNSSAEVVSDGKSDTSGNDGTANVQVNRNADDASSVTVRFWHNLHYTGNVPNNLGEDICTNFDFSYSSNPLISNNKVADNTIKDDNPNKSGNQYCTSKHAATSKNASKSELGNKNEAVGVSYDITINNLQPGENKICQTIKYEPKNFLVFQDQNGSSTMTNGGSGRGESTACVTITKGKGTPPPEIDLNIDKEIYYAGEPDTLIWKQAKPSSGPTKVLREMRLFYYQVPVNVTTDGDPARGIEKTNKDPYDWFQEISRGSGFKEVKTISDNTNYHLEETDPPFHSSKIVPSEPTPELPDLSGTNIDIVVPDKVGDKICLSVASKYQEYKVTPHPGHEHYATDSYGRSYLAYTDTTYTYDKNEDEYWQIEGATCRTIVKKPSTNIWNGSLSTQSGVTTTVSNRYSQRSNPGYIITSISENVGAEKNKFGSWSEYLAVVGGQVASGDGDAAKAIFSFGSGASLAYRGSGLNASIIDNSPLTIANTSTPVGNSGIRNTSTFISRLRNFVQNNTTDSSVSGISGNTSINNTRIVYTSAPITIDGNIEITNPTNGIRTLPQVVIYTEGDITITPNVTRIDAWLITPNSVIDMCKDFNASTPAYVQGYNSLDAAACSKQLTINGPVIASGAKLTRSAGSDPISYSQLGSINTSADPRSIPGEVFNLSANTYLWAYAQASSSNSSYTEAYSRELPPRY